MSNPSSGTGPESPAEPVFADSEPTEVIDVASGDDEAGDERRYTAPGFDAGSTQIIDRVPDPPTELIATLRTGPQEIPPAAPRRPRWRRPGALVVAALMIAAVLGLFLWQRSSAAASRENQVRTAIETFDSAVRAGDLAMLRTLTCGQTRKNYDDYDQEAWSDTYAKVMAAKQYPVVASIDEVAVHGDHAEANVTAYMAYDPATTSRRSFDLEYRDSRWKICEAS